MPKKKGASRKKKSANTGQAPGTPARLPVKQRNRFPADVDRQIASLTKFRKKNKNKLLAQKRKTALGEVLLLQDPNYTEERNPFPITKEWIETETTTGEKVNVPAERFVTLYRFTHSKWNQKLGLTDQGPHTMAHVLMDQLFAEAVKANTKEAFATVFSEQVPTPEGIFNLIKEETTFDNLEGNPKWSYQRYLTYYTELHAYISELLTLKAPDLELLALNIRAIMELHPYATYSWKSPAKAAKSSLDAGGERTIDLTIATREELDKLMDGLGSRTFSDKEKLNAFLVQRLSMALNDDRLRETGFMETDEGGEENENGKDENSGDSDSDE